MKKIAKRILTLAMPILMAFNASAAPPGNKKNLEPVRPSTELMMYMQSQKITPHFDEAANKQSVLYPFKIERKEVLAKSCPFHTHAEDVYGQVMPRVAMSQILSNMPLLRSKPMWLFYGSTADNKNPIAYRTQKSQVPDVYFIAQDLNDNHQIEASELVFMLKQNNAYTSSRQLYVYKTMDDYFFRDGKGMSYKITYLPEDKNLRADDFKCEHGDVHRDIPKEDEMMADNAEPPVVKPAEDLTADQKPKPAAPETERPVIVRRDPPQMNMRR